MSQYNRDEILEMIKAGQSLAGLDLSGADLSYETMKGADFSGADLSNARVDAGVVIDESVVLPELLLNLLASDDFAGSAQQHLEELGRLRVELDRSSVPAEFTALRIECERAESNHDGSHTIGARPQDALILLT